MAEEPLCVFDHVGFGYGPATVIDDVHITIGPDEFVGLVGPSGAGKTTVLKLLLGLVEPTYDSVDRDAAGTCGYVPQVETIDWTFPVTVFDVVAMAVERRRFRRLTADDRQRVISVLERLRLGDYAGRQISELSGGQQQRTFIARALVHEPQLLVLDEPTSGIDVAARHELLHLLADLHRAGTSVLLTTHDINGLAAHLPRLICFNRTVIADGPPAQVVHPYVLERTYGAPMEVLQHGGMPVVLDHPTGEPHAFRDRPAVE